mgnify:CR=1 FL=1|jgi:hypothetical protein
MSKTDRELALLTIVVIGCIIDWDSLWCSLFRACL